MSASGERFGRYELRGELGRGGFATVHRAWDPSLGREVALKALLLHLAADEGIRHRFLGESRAIARLHHPNIVTVYEVDESEGRPYFTMERIDGPTLSSFLAAEHQLPLAQVAQIMRGLASAIDYLHSRRLVHRDIKASNVMLDTWDRIVLMDFGVARALDETQLTRSGISIGTPEAMSPEQVNGQPVGPPADIYALGVLAYRLLAGRPPFVGDTIHVIHAHVYEDPPPLAEFRPGLPESVYITIKSALAKAPQDRPQLAQALAAALLASTPATQKEPDAAAATFLVVPPKSVREPRPPLPEVPYGVTPPPFVAEPASSSASLGGAEARTILSATPPHVATPPARGADQLPQASPALQYGAGPGGMVVSPTHTSLPPNQGQTGAGALTRRGRSGRLLAGAAALLVALVVGGVLFVAARGEGHPRTSTSSTASSAAGGAVPPATATSDAATSAVASASAPATAAASSVATAVATSSATVTPPAGAASAVPTAAATATATASTAGVTVLAGAGGAGFLDGAADQALFNAPKGVAVDGTGAVYVADTQNSRIRRIDPAGQVTTLAGPGSDVSAAAGYSDQPGTAARFNEPRGVALDKDGALYVADTDNNRIRRIDHNGSVSTLAGGGGTDIGSGGFADGTGPQARFSLPTGLAVASDGTIYVADQRNNAIRKIDLSGAVRTLAGSTGSGRVDGQGTAAQFNGPTAVAVDRQGNVYVADTFNGLIRKVSPDGQVSTYAGGGSANTMVGSARSVALVFPEGIAVDSAGNVYVADQTHTIREITPDGNVVIVVGSKEGFANNAGVQAQFDFPSGLALAGDSTLYVADTTNNRIRAISLH